MELCFRVHYVRDFLSESLVVSWKGLILTLTQTIVNNLRIPNYIVFVIAENAIQTVEIVLNNFV